MIRKKKMSCFLCLP